MTADLAGAAAPLDPPTVRIPAQRSAPPFTDTAPRSGMPPFSAPTGLPPSAPRRGGAVVVLSGMATAALVIGLGLALSTVVGTAAPGGLFDSLTSGGEFTLTGELSLADEGYGSGSCSGSGGYSDIGVGTSVTVADASGTVVATGRLDSGRSRLGDCVFPFSVGGVAGAGDFYRVEVSHRGEVTFSRDELDTEGALLSLGY